MIRVTRRVDPTNEKTMTMTMTKTKTRTDLLGVGAVGSEAPGLLHLLLAHWVPAVVVLLTKTLFA